MPRPVAHNGFDLSDDVCRRSVEPEFSARASSRGGIRSSYLPTTFVVSISLTKVFVCTNMRNQQPRIHNRTNDETNAHANCTIDHIATRPIMDVAW